jgi:hypothetical protein
MTPPRYLIISDGQDGEYEADYVDYLLEVEYRKDAGKLIDIPEGDGRGSEWDNARPDVPSNFRIGKDTV